MPSAEHLKEKQAVIDEIKDKFGKAQSAIVIDYIGISVAEADAMRKKLREAAVDYKVYKNTLVKRAIEGTGYAALSDALAGPSAIAFGFEDAVAPARVLNGIFKDFKKMEFKAGIIEGTFFNTESLKEVATLPTKAELIGKFLGSIQSPIGALTRTFKAIADAKPADGAEAPAAAAAPAEDAKPAEAEASAPAEAAKPAEAEAPAAAAAPAEDAKPAEAETSAPAEAAKPAEAEAAPEAPAAEAAPAAADSADEAAKTE